VPPDASVEGGFMRGSFGYIGGARSLEE